MMLTNSLSFQDERYKISKIIKIMSSLRKVNPFLKKVFFVLMKTGLFEFKEKYIKSNANFEKKGTKKFMIN